MLTKEKVQAQINSLPNEFSLDELVERLIFLEKVETGLSQIEKGESFTSSEVEKEMAKWFK